MTHEDYREMLAQHALGALDAAEARALEAHLSGCDTCRAELAEWSDIGALLAYSAPLVEPPPALRASLLNSIRGAQATSSEATTKRGANKTAEVASETTAATNVVQMPQRTSVPRSNAWQRYVALAASLAFVAFIISLVVLWNRNQAMRAEMARLNRDLQTAQERLKREQEISLMFTAPDTRLATLNGTEMAPRARARLAYNKSGEAMMIADELPPAPAGKDYQIWFIADGKPVPGGVFKPDARGHVEMHDRIPDAARSAAAFAITLEPQGGTAAPTGQKYLLGAASS